MLTIAWLWNPKKLVTAFAALGLDGKSAARTGGCDGGKLMKRTGAAVAAMAILLPVMAMAQDVPAPEDLACCVTASTECSVATIEDCLAGPGVPVPGLACCSVGVLRQACVEADPPDCDTGEAGACAAGFPRCDDEGTLVCQRYADPEPEMCNGIDDNCDGTTDEGGAALCPDDGNSCTVSVCDGAQGCRQEPLDGASCDDGDPCTVNDVCASGVCQQGSPRNCDDGNPCTNDFCSQSNGQCFHQPFDADGDGFTTCEGDCDDSNSAVHPAAQEICGDGIDNDCDGAIDDGCGCQSGEVEPCDTGQPGQCSAGSRTCNAAGNFSVCTQEQGPSSEVCDAIDNDCDGQVDEEALCPDDGNPCTVSTCQSGSCTQAPLDGESCDDGDVCTVNDTCQSGSCSGTPDPACG